MTRQAKNAAFALTSVVVLASWLTTLDHGSSALPSLEAACERTYRKLYTVGRTLLEVWVRAVRIGVAEIERALPQRYV